MTKRKEMGFRVCSKRSRESGRKWVDGIVRVTWLTICSVTRRRFSSSSGTECGEGIARVHSPESYFPLAHYRTVRTPVHSCDRTYVYPQSRSRTRAFNVNEHYLKRICTVHSSCHYPE